MIRAPSASAESHAGDAQSHALRTSQGAWSEAWRGLCACGVTPSGPTGVCRGSSPGLALVRMNASLVGEQGRLDAAGRRSSLPRAPRNGPCHHRAALSGRAILERVTDPLAADETRIDRWLCAVRLVKTRPLATRLCEGGHVLVNGSPAKPSTKVRAGDRVEALIADRKRIVEVTRPIESRVGAAVAATCYVDHSPPVVPEPGPAIRLIRGEGRPSKHRRREFERLRRGSEA